MKEKLKTICKTMLEIIITLLFVTMLSFILMRISPINPAEAYVRRNSTVVTDESIKQVYIKLGLDKPLYIQYFQWLKDSVHMEFGISLKTGHLVIEEIGRAVPLTVSIVGISALIMIIGTLIFGTVLFMVRNNTVRKLLNGISMIGISIPPFYLAIIFLDTFAVKLDWMKIAGNQGLFRYLPATICIAVSGICFYSRLLLDNLDREMKEDYIVYARCRGLSDMCIIFCHALPNALINLIPNFMQTIGLCLAGAAIIERVFSLPGLGYLIIDAVIARDAPVIHATILFLAFAIVLLDLVARWLQNLLQRKKILEIR